MGSESLTGAALDAAIERALGDDLTCGENRERIAEAVLGGCRVTRDWVFEWNKREFDIGRIEAGDFYMGYGGVKGNSGYGVWFWDNRAGQPWQAALEAHVAAYRAEPRPFHRDLRLAMGLLPPYAEIQVEPQHVQVMLAPSKSSQASGSAFVSHDEFPDADEAEQRVLATCAAICRAVLPKESVK